MDRRKVGRALVLLGAVLLLAGDMLLLAERTSAHGEILGDVWLWGLGEALSEEGGHIGAYKLLANTFDHVYLLCAAALAPLLLRGAGRVPWDSPRRTSSASPSTSSASSPS